ncbi:mechanosensitive ion channel family protein [Paenibacillus gansuensis]|uniref:Mechanosensitive ion channel family protein n=1 Tax=Paenibacillus gansuensis TaxID=306542 RepID=A0ABW5PL66_9BACL
MNALGKWKPEDYWNNLTSIETWQLVGWVVLKIVIIIILGRVLVNIAFKILDQAMKEREHTRLKIDTRRTHTIVKLVKNIVSSTVYFIIILLVLSEIGINLAPLLAGAGVLGLAIGFGAQTLVKDIITGFFIIFEDQFAVGDTIQTGTYKGTVEVIGLRTTRLKSWTGEVHFIPNGSIVQVTNYSLNNSIAVVDITIPNDIHVDSAIEAIKETVAKEFEKSEDMVRQPEVLGIQSVGTAEVVVRITAECRTNTHMAVSRLLNAEIKRAMDEVKAGADLKGDVY